MRDENRPQRIRRTGRGNHDPEAFGSLRDNYRFLSVKEHRFFQTSVPTLTLTEKPKSGLFDLFVVDIEKPQIQERFATPFPPLSVDTFEAKLSPSSVF